MISRPFLTDCLCFQLFVDPNRMFEKDAGSTTMTLTVCTVPELEEKIQKELGL